jgi:hypothetical protein
MHLRFNRHQKRLVTKQKQMQSNEIRRKWIASYGIQRNQTETNESKRKLM